MKYYAVSIWAHRGLLPLTGSATDDAGGFVGHIAVSIGRLDGFPTALAGTEAGRGSRRAAP